MYLNYPKPGLLIEYNKDELLNIHISSSHLGRRYRHLVWHLDSFNGFIHEAKHEEVAVHSSREDIFVIEACLDVSDAAMMVIMHI